MCRAVTRNGRAAAVILSPEQYDRLRYESFVRAKIARSVEDIAAGRVHSLESVMAEARKRLRGRGKKKEEAAE